MHIPDGYLSPATYGAMYVAATPFWAVAVARVRNLLRGRTAPLLSVFSALTFAVMMFNVPVPGGTTAHATGATLTAVVLGPWAAVISTSVALVIQALFFGDGGVTAIGANCFNIGVALPITGYVTYRLIAGNSDVLAQRRVIAAAIGSYLGITVAALLTGVELGIQPHFWSTNGVPDYSPYGLSTAIPSMIVSHVFGASFVEAAVTALGVAYLQKSYPELLLGGHERTAAVVHRARTISPWVAVAALMAVVLPIMFVAGLAKGGWDLAQWAGLDWATVSWTDAGQTVLVSALVSAGVLPLLVFLLRRRPGLRAVVTVFVALMIWAPIGLIPPAGAFAEDTSVTPQELDAALSARASGDTSLFDALPDLNKECECVPTHINDVTFAGNTLLAGYQPPWVKATDPAWKQNLGYQIAGFAGIAVLAVIGFGLFQFARWLMPEAPPDWRTS